MVSTDTTASPKDGAGLEGSVVGNRYRIAEIVSAGANAVITDAHDTEADQPVTLKIVRPELAQSEEFRRAFHRCAEVASALSHPNIAAVLDWGETDVHGSTAPFWVVEYLDGGSLRDLFDRGRLLEPSQALVVGLEACRALAAAHQRGLTHSEITPSKLVFGKDARLRIVDFAMAELLGRRAWTEPATVATHVARYAAPEQALGLGAQPKSDVYSLALCLLESVTGKVPFDGESTVSTLAARVGKLLPVSADLGSLASVLERAGRPDAEDRTDAAEFGQALVRAAERLPRPTPIPVLSTERVDTAQMRRPTDPTGGIGRPDETVETPDAGDRNTAVAGAAVVGAAAAAPATITSPGTVPAEAAAVDVEPVDRVVEPVDGGAIEDPPETEPLSRSQPEAGSRESENEPTPATTGGSHDDALIIMTDVARNPTGSVEVAQSGAFDRAAAVAATAAMPVAPTTEMAAHEAAPAPVGASDHHGAGAPPAAAPRRRVGVTVAMSLFVIAAIAALAVVGVLLLQTKSYEVPDLVGADEAVALNEIAGNDWVVLTERERSDEQPVEGAVIRTFPAAGVELDEGSEFTMFVSQGPEFRSLPELDGLTTDEALAELEALLLTGFVGTEVFDETIPPGSVVSWIVSGDSSKVAGDDVLPGTNIALTVSVGPAPRSVPDITGSSVADARAAIEAIQLDFVIGAEVFSDDVAEGDVASQSPAPGAEVARDSTITVEVSKGIDLVELPDLEGLTFAEAQRALTDAGFTIGTLLGTTDGTFESITVDADPVGDTGMYRRGTEVDLIFL